MSVDATDVLEEHERNEIRGTLLGVSRMTTLRVAKRSVDIVDPYTREVRLWVKPSMSIAEIINVMQHRLGMVPIAQTKEAATFEIKYGSKYTRILIRTKPFAIKFS